MSRQITEINCEEGWSYIAEWIGTPLASVFDNAGVSAEARYVVYRSYDSNPGTASISTRPGIHRR